MHRSLKASLLILKTSNLFFLHQDKTQEYQHPEKREALSAYAAHTARHMTVQPTAYLAAMTLKPLSPMLSKGFRSLEGRHVMMSNEAVRLWIVV